MSESELINRVSILPKNLKDEVSDYVDFLLSKYVSQERQKKPLKFGMMKGTFQMADDFDAPLDEFKDYMP